MTTFNSSKLNERQKTQTQYGVLALQRSINGSTAISYFTRYNNLHSFPIRPRSTVEQVASDVTDSPTPMASSDAAYAIAPRVRCAPALR